MVIVDQLNDIADAIRERKGVNYSISLANMADEIRSISAVRASTIEPTDINSLWIDLNSNSVKYYNGNEWVAAELVWG